MSLALGVLAFIVGLIALVMTAHLLVTLARDWAEDRAREARFAREWCATHREHQDKGRYLADDPQRPE